MERQRFLNPKLAEFAKFYGTVVLPCKPGMPRHKGTCEAGVDYAQENAVKGRRFESLGAQNIYLAEWERNVASGGMKAVQKRRSEIRCSSAGFSSRF